MKFLDREEIDRNTLRQASKILKFIGESYDLGPVRSTSMHLIASADFWLSSVRAGSRELSTRIRKLGEVVYERVRRRDSKETRPDY